VADLQEIVNDLEAEIRRPISVEDRRWRLLAHSAQPDEADAVRRSSILTRETSPDVVAWLEGLGLHRARDLVDVPPNDALGMIRRGCLPIRHGDVLTMLEFVTDPVYLTEPMVRSQNWVWTRDQELAPYPCESVTEVPRELGLVPHHLPGTNTFLHEFSAKYKLPYEVTRGGSETMYPEYRQRIEAFRVTEKTAASAK